MTDEDRDALEVAAHAARIVVDIILTVTADRDEAHKGLDAIVSDMRRMIDREAEDGPVVGRAH